jgi:hypothetical protein
MTRLVDIATASLTSRFSSGHAIRKRGKAGTGVRYVIRVPLHPHQAIYGCSNCYVGLLRLEAKGLARVDFISGNAQEFHPCVVVLEVARDDGSSLRLGIDIRDRSDEFDIPVLDNVDVYFKRSFERKGLQALDADSRRKCLPIGPYFPCGASGLVPRILRSMGARYLLNLARAAVNNRDLFADDSNMLKQFVTLPRVDEYESSPTEPTQPVVLFQTRVWEQRDASTDDVAELNESRAALVRALRREFGKRFRGGIVPTPFALRYFGDVITAHPHGRFEYIRMNRPALIGVSTRGLHHSTPFKLGEYLASSKAIVSEPIDHELNDSLHEGTHFLSFRTSEECVAQCANLLSHPARTTEMRQANHRLYVEQVEPGAAISQCIDVAFETARPDKRCTNSNLPS